MKAHAKEGAISVIPSLDVVLCGASFYADIRSRGELGQLGGVRRDSPDQ